MGGKPFDISPLKKEWYPDRILPHTFLDSLSVLSSVAFLFKILIEYTIIAEINVRFPISMTIAT